MRPDLKTGDITLSCLLLSVISGIFLGYQYDCRTAYDSIITIDVTLPWGKYLRSLHWYSSQAFFILFLIHTGEHILKGSYANMPDRAWARLVFSMLPAALLLFTGYTLKGDITGASAATIAEHLALSLPFIGDSLNRILFAFGREGLSRIYLNHVLVLEVAGIWLLWAHLKRRMVDIRRFTALFIFFLPCCFLWQAPIAAPSTDSDTMLIKGPRFFLGIQELLRSFPPLWAGVVFPATLIILLAILPLVKENYQRKVLVGLGVFISSDVVLTILALIR